MIFTLAVANNYLGIKKNYMHSYIPLSQGAERAARCLKGKFHGCFRRVTTVENMHTMLATSTAVCRPVALASPGSLLEMQNLKPRPDLLNQNLHFNKTVGEFLCSLKSGEQCSRRLLCACLSNTVWRKVVSFIMGM